MFSGRRTYELRLNDFEINEGDTPILEEWDHKTKQYTGRTISKQVTYVGTFNPHEFPFWFVSDIQNKELQIISIRQHPYDQRWYRQF